MNENSILYEVVKDEIQKARAKIHDGCQKCSTHTVMCFECQKKFIEFRDVKKSNLPPSRVKYLKEGGYLDNNATPPDIKVGEFDFVKELLKKDTVWLFDEVFAPFIDYAEKVTEEGHSVFLIGNNATGKTTAAVYVALKFLAQKYSVYYCTFPQLHRFHTMSFEDPMYDLMLEELQQVDLLIVDEMGKETNKTSSVLYLADTYLKAREEYMRPTILISNLPVEEFSTSDVRGGMGYGPSFWSMLKERYRIFVFNPRAADLRLANRISWSFR